MTLYGRIHSFENFGTVDGPGVRFVIFMQGCLLRCQYCHNPDSWDLNGGNLYTPLQVIEKVKRYTPYLKASGGGITVSGGEPLLQLEFLTELFKLSKDLNLHTAIDTSGFILTSNPQLDTLLEYTDLILLDIKHMNPTIHQKLTGQTNTNTLEFARYLDKKKIPTCIRHVLVPSLTDDIHGLSELNTFVKSLSNIKSIEVLPFHNMGSHKWESLNIKYNLDNSYIPSDFDIIRVKEVITAAIL